MFYLWIGKGLIQRKRDASEVRLELPCEKESFQSRLKKGIKLKISDTTLCLFRKKNVGFGSVEATRLM